MLLYGDPGDIALGLERENRVAKESKVLLVDALSSLPLTFVDESEMLHFTSTTLPPTFSTSSQTTLISAYFKPTSWFGAKP